ncbi:restriction endonuclease-like protein [Geomonas paludis]|uniref:Restriction endonuclease-like protein n=1 Tax=Geomonas paludis TaxID=2740185 RepID=A0ABY4LIA8_9BACT|nr:DUF2357 domain-containing protein [Geomonas paludis]UPU37489.1 restriction endonuclease-like protein [Geomonas paludis]
MALGDDPFFPAEEPVTALSEPGVDYPVLQEWQSYFVKFYGNEVPPFFPEPEAGLFTQRRFPAQLFEISFRNAVGLTRIGPVPLRVANNKIGEASYEAMLSYLADQFSSLVFSFGATLGENYRKNKVGKDIAYLEYLFLKRFLLDASPDVDAIATMIAANPHHRLFREHRRCPIDAVTDPDPMALLQVVTESSHLARLRAGHHLQQTALAQALRRISGLNLFPSEAPQQVKYVTVDTNENRFVKYFLESILRRLQRLGKVFPAGKKSYLNQDVVCNLDRLSKKIESFLADPIWKEVGCMSFIPVASQVLQRREGYRQLFRLFSLLQLTSRCDFVNRDDFKNLVETKDTPTLFEYWSFFIVKEVIDNLLPMETCGRVVAGDELEQAVAEGLCVRYRRGVSIWFNKTYRGSRGCQVGGDMNGYGATGGSYSHNFRPDIVLDNGKRILIFDAKYKGERGGFYCEGGSGTILSWKDEDVDKMHCYREAIRNVAGAFILYPGEESVVYPIHGAKEIFEGVGALPLKPGTGARPQEKHFQDLRRIILRFLDMEE